MDGPGLVGVAPSVAAGGARGLAGPRRRRLNPEKLKTPTAEGNSSLTSDQERRAAQAAAFDQLGERYDEAFPHKSGQIAATARLLERARPGARVLDAGCGTGLPSARQLVDAGCDVTGVDISAGILELARHNVPRGRFRQLDICDIDPSLGSFDAIVAFFSLLMLPRTEIPFALRTLGRPSSPAGGWCSAWWRPTWTTCRSRSSAGRYG